MMQLMIDLPGDSGEIALSVDSGTYSVGKVVRFDIRGPGVTLSADGNVVRGADGVTLVLEAHFERLVL